MTAVPVNWVSLGKRVAIVLQIKTEGDEDRDSDAVKNLYATFIYHCTYLMYACDLWLRALTNDTAFPLGPCNYILACICIHLTNIINTNPLSYRIWVNFSQLVENE